MNQNLDVGRVLTNAFEIYQNQAGVLIGSAFAVFLVEAIAVGVLTIALGLLGLFVGLIITVVANTLYQGMVVALVNDVRDGKRDSSVGDLFESITGAVVPLILAGLLAGLGIVVGFIFLIVPGLILLTWWAVISPVIVLERPGVVAALGRSRELVRGNGWPVFGVVVIVFLIQLVVGGIIGGIGAAGGDVGRIIGDVIGSTITAPIVALAASVLYFSLREVKGDLAPGTGPLDAPGGQAPATGAAAPAPESQPPPPPPAAGPESPGS